MVKSEVSIKKLAQVKKSTYLLKKNWKVWKHLIQDFLRDKSRFAEDET